MHNFDKWLLKIIFTFPPCFRSAEKGKHIIYRLQVTIELEKRKPFHLLRKGRLKSRKPDKPDGWSVPDIATADNMTNSYFFKETLAPH